MDIRERHRHAPALAGCPALRGRAGGRPRRHDHDPVFDLCGGIMKLRTGLLAAPACAVAAAALLAAPALAATTFTVSPGGAWSGTRAADSSVGIRDAVSNQVTLCSGLA